MDYRSKPHNDSPKNPEKHYTLFSFLMAGLPQLIPGGGIIADFFKSMPTTYIFRSNDVKNWATGSGYSDNFVSQSALGNAIWIGGQAITVDILLSGFQDLNNLLPYIRAFVCGSANQEYFPFSGPTRAFWERNQWPSGLEYWAASLAQGTKSEVNTLEQLHSLWAFLLGFLAMRNNVGGSAISSAALSGLATGSSMIVNPWVFESAPGVSPVSYALKTYVMAILSMALTEGLLARLLENRVSKVALDVIIGLANAGMQSKKFQSLVMTYLMGVTIPPLTYSGGDYRGPTTDPVPRVGIPVSYAAY